MAAWDYGAVLRVNKKVINKHEKYMNMKETVGFTLEEVEELEWGNPVIDGNYFVYAGDEELLVCIYKTQVVFISHGKVIERFSGYSTMKNIFTYTTTINKTTFKYKKLRCNDRFLISFWYKGDFYECIFGYGISYFSENWWIRNPKAVNRILNKWRGTEVV